jgi:drug/metabolite transporter (DMT)-like permease
MNSRLCLCFFGGTVGAMQSRLPTLALVAVVTGWASAFVAIRAIAPFVDPAPMAAGRLLVGALALLAALAIRGGTRPRGRALTLTIGYGALWFALYTVLVNAAEQHLDAGTTALLVNIAPIVVAVLAGAFLGEGFPPLLLVGIAVSFAGVAIIAFAGSGHRDTVGVLLAVAAALLYAISVVAQKLVLRTVDPLSATAIGAAVGAIVMLPWLPRLVDQLGHARWEVSAGIVYLGLIPTALAFLLWAYALGNLPAGVTISAGYAVPTLSVLMSWALLGEAPGPVALIGGALSLAGVAIARLRPATPRPATTPPPAARPRRSVDS